MVPLVTVSPVQVEGVVYPPSVKPPGSSDTLFLGGAGYRGLEIQGKFVKFTTIGVYLAYEALPLLAVKWKGKTAQELTDSVEFFREIVTGSFEKFARVTLISTLTGQQFSKKVIENCVAYCGLLDFVGSFEKFARVTLISTLTGQQFSKKVIENCVAIWKSLGVFTNAEAAAAEKFKEVFKDQTFPPSSSILFTLSPPESLKIGFSKDSSVSEQPIAIIENKQMMESVLESMIGKHGVSPEARKSIAIRMGELLKDCHVEDTQKEGEKLEVGVKA